MSDKELEAIKKKKAESIMLKMTAKGELLMVTDGNFQKTISGKGLVLVDFWAPWCGPCRMIAPVLEEIAQKYAGSVIVAKMNVDENGATPSQFGIMGIPTLLFFKNGKLVDKVVGFLPKEQLETRIKSNLK